MSKATPKRLTGLDIYLIVVAAILLLCVFNLYKEDIFKSSAHQAQEKELAFQKEKEETRKAEFAKLLRIHEEEKRAAEERRIEEEREKPYKEAAKLLKEEQERQDRLLALALQSFQSMSDDNRRRAELREKEREESYKEVAKLLKEEHVPSPEAIPSVHSLNTVVKARIINDFDGLKEGNIYKLDNGQIWEQTDFYIHIRIAIMPSVVIWRDGAVYKMIVDGIDKAVAVQQLK
jgi:hypothetical protein